jgi:hypothetical protein
MSMSNGHHPTYALTSLSPSPEDRDVQLATLQTWADAGLEARSFNHPTEIATMSARYDVQFISTTGTIAHVFGRHYIPINTIVDWAAQSGESALIINADIHLQLAS